jgi:2,4-dienoyl-CoA reductase-like NADH-dependent reductase (Old Yellow Enzyme family)
MRAYPAIGGIKTVADFKAHLASLQLSIPCDDELQTGPSSPLAQPINIDNKRIGNRFCIHPMEGWDGTLDGKPTEATIRRWRNFGLSGAKLIWGGEAVAVRQDARANPNQLLINEKNKQGLAELRDVLLSAHLEVSDSTDDLLIGLQLTHSGRFSRPNEKTKPEPRILYHHPTLDARVGVDQNHPLLTDGEIHEIIDDFIRAAHMANQLGFEFVDIKHCHGYLGHEFLSAHTREGQYGGSFENRTRFLREITEGIRAMASNLIIGVRVSAFDLVSFGPDPQGGSPGKLGPGIPDSYDRLLPYRFGFGVNADHPEHYDLEEPRRFLSLLRELDIRLVNITAGSPYYNPHIQRPALYPPSDGYQPPEDPLIGVARQMEATRLLKQEFQDLTLVGTAYTYLQEFLPFVAQAAVREGSVDSIGLGRMVLAYPELPLDIISGHVLAHKKICRTFSDCTTAPRNGLPSGCYPLDSYYKESELGVKLKQIKAAKRSAVSDKL